MSLWSQNCWYPFLNFTVSSSLMLIPISSSCNITSDSLMSPYGWIIYYGTSIVKTSSNLVLKSVWRAFKCWTYAEPSSFWQFVYDKLGNWENFRHPMFCFIRLILARNAAMMDLQLVFIKFKLSPCNCKLTSLNLVNKSVK